MFEPDYTETMSMLLDAIGQQQSDLLSGEGTESEVAQFLKRRNELSTADEIEKSEAQDECGETGATSISKQISECERSDDLRTQESNFIDRIIDEFGGEA